MSKDYQYENNLMEDGSQEIKVKIIPDLQKRTEIEKIAHQKVKEALAEIKAKESSNSFEEISFTRTAATISTSTTTTTTTTTSTNAAAAKNNKSLDNSNIIQEHYLFPILEESEGEEYSAKKEERAASDNYHSSTDDDEDVFTLEESEESEDEYIPVLQGQEKVSNPVKLIPIGEESKYSEDEEYLKTKSEERATGYILESEGSEDETVDYDSSDEELIPEPVNNNNPDAPINPKSYQDATPLVARIKNIELQDSKGIFAFNEQEEPEAAVFSVKNSKLAIILRNIENAYNILILKEGELNKSIGLGGKVNEEEYKKAYDLMEDKIKKAEEAREVRLQKEAKDKIEQAEVVKKARLQRGEERRGEFSISQEELSVLGRPQSSSTPNSKSQAQREARQQKHLGLIEDWERERILRQQEYQKMRLQQQRRKEEEERAKRQEDLRTVMIEPEKDKLRLQLEEEKLKLLQREQDSLRLRQAQEQQDLQEKILQRQKEQEELQQARQAKAEVVSLNQKSKTTNLNLYNQKLSNNSINLEDEQKYHFSSNSTELLGDNKTDAFTTMIAQAINTASNKGEISNYVFNFKAFFVLTTILLAIKNDGIANAKDQEQLKKDFFTLYGREMEDNELRYMQRFSYEFQKASEELGLRTGRQEGKSKDVPLRLKRLNPELLAQIMDKFFQINGVQESELELELAFHEKILREECSKLMGCEQSNDAVLQLALHSAKKTPVKKEEEPNPTFSSESFDKLNGSRQNSHSQ